MYIEYDTKYNAGQTLYKLEGAKIETWKVEKVECTITGTEDVESHSTRYYIVRADNKHGDYWLSQNDAAKVFFTDKKDILKKIADQL